jgi:hypothetical protein
MPEQKETDSADMSMDAPSSEMTLEQRYYNFFSRRELESAQKQDILREISEPFAPLDEALIRVIDIRHAVSRGSHWDRFLLQSIKELNEKLSEFQRKVDEISESLQNQVKVYNSTLYELGSKDYELIMPVQVVIEEDQDETVARIPELNLYASADTDAEAIYDLKKEVLVLYEDLTKSESSGIKLGPLPRAWLQTLKRIVMKKNGQVKL